MKHNLYKIPYVITSMVKTKLCRCGHTDKQHLPKTVGRQGSKEEWNSKIAYKGQCAFCEPSGANACLEFTEVLH